jgi:hypothetical protein
MRDRRERGSEGNAERDGAELWERRGDSVFKARVGTGLAVTGAVGAIAGLAWLANSFII